MKIQLKSGSAVRCSTPVNLSVAMDVDTNIKHTERVRGKGKERRKKKVKERERREKKNSQHQKHTTAHTQTLLEGVFHISAV